MHLSALITDIMVDDGAMTVRTHPLEGSDRETVVETNDPYSQIRPGVQAQNYPGLEPWTCTPEADLMP